MSSSKVDVSHHVFKIISFNTALCSCGMAYLGGDTIHDKRIRHSIHQREVERYLTEQQEQREAEAGYYVRRKLREVGVSECGRGILIAAAPQQPRRKAAAQRGVAEQAAPASVEGGLVRR